MASLIHLVAAVMMVFPAFSQPAVDPAYSRTKIIFEKTNVSDKYTTVYDANGNVMGTFTQTPLEVPVDDKFISQAALVPSDGRTKVLMNGTLLRKTKLGWMVRVLPANFDRYQADKSNMYGGFGGLNTPSGAMYVPLADFQNGKYSIRGITAGSDTKANPAYKQLMKTLKEPSGSFVQTGIDPEDSYDSGLVQTVDPKYIAIYPPTCDCKTSCAVTSLFGPRKAPTKGASTFHRGLDIGSGTGTTLIAPDRVVVETHYYSNSYGNRIILRSLTYTNPQLYYAFNHMVKEPNVETGTVLEPGDFIGLMGRTGVSTGTHLHFEVYKGSAKYNGNQIDPLPLIRMNMTKLSQDRPEIVNYSCNTLRARIKGGPALPGGGSYNKAVK